jgi:RNA polymerase sigma-70 factor (ECF subfamily)
MTIIESHDTGQSVSKQTDETLLRRIATGDNDGLQELLRRYQTPIHRFLTRYLGSAEDAEQATLNVFVRVWQHAPRFQFQAQVSTWLYRIALNIARDMYRHARLKTVALPEEHRMHSTLVGNAEEDALRRMEQEDQFRQLQQALQRLNETDRLLLVLYYFEDRSYEEIQAISGLSYKVLKTRLSRARQRLRAWLGEAS